MSEGIKTKILELPESCSGILFVEYSTMSSDQIDIMQQWDVGDRKIMIVQCHDVDKIKYVPIDHGVRVTE